MSSKQSFTLTRSFNRNRKCLTFFNFERSHWNISSSPIQFARQLVAIYCFCFVSDMNCRLWTRVNWKNKVVYAVLCLIDVLCFAPLWLQFSETEHRCDTHDAYSKCDNNSCTMTRRKKKKAKTPIAQAHEHQLRLSNNVLQCNFRLNSTFFLYCISKVARIFFYRTSGINKTEWMTQIQINKWVERSRMKTTNTTWQRRRRSSSRNRGRQGITYTVNLSMSARESDRLTNQ